MTIDRPKPGAPGTTGQSPRWEGPEATRPRGYLPARDDPERDPDANGETDADPSREKLHDAGKTKDDEAEINREQATTPAPTPIGGRAGAA